MSAELTQIIYKEEQRAECYPFANVVFNRELTVFFENSVIWQVVRASQAEKIAVCSWKLRQKQHWNVGKRRQITQDLIESEYDVLSFTKNTAVHGMLYASEQWHPGFITAMKTLGAKIHFKVPYEVKNPVYQNAFSAKTHIYKAYVDDYLLPCIYVMRNDPEMRALSMQDSRYHELAKGDAAPREWLQKQIGIPYYPMAPFLLERLFSIFCHNNKINVTYI